jgi:hypothetical protein
MTIAEHLKFSVLSAPIASLDRRALSQAWYSTLYGNAAPERSRTLSGASPSPSRHTAFITATFPVLRDGGEHAIPAAARKAPQTGVRSGVEIERRAPRSGLARKIERTFLHPRARVRKASFAIDGVQGRVQVLLQSSGGRLKLVAICPPAAKAHVAAALAQARYALALRGIALETQTRGTER